MAAGRLAMMKADWASAYRFRARGRDHPRGARPRANTKVVEPGG